MKFTCERCDAQYMIADEKVGPNGVKVRCKKCSNVIHVRRAVENGAIAAEAPAKSAAPAPAGTGEHALDRELGNAFDQAFGDPPAAAPVATAPAPDLDATQKMSSDEPAAPAPPASEWYVAIGQAQVGPLPLADVKKKWEAGDVGPDSLVWRPGMGDWAPLSSVQDLAAYLAPVPQASARAAAVGEPAPAPARAAEPALAAVAAGGGGVAAARQPEVSWKPMGASALAALASEEIATRERPEPRSEAQRPVPSGVKSLVEELPDGGGVDPTGAIPLPIKALEKTSEQKIERRSSVARGAEELRHKRSAARAVAMGVAAVVVVVAAVAAGMVWYVNQKTRPTPAVATAPQPAAKAAAPVAAPAPAAPVPAAAPATTPTAPSAVAAAAEPARAPAPVPAKAEPAPEPPAPKAAEPARRAEPPATLAHHESAPSHRKEAREPPARKEKEPVRVAQAPPPAPSQPAPQPPPQQRAARKDSVLDFDGGGNDPALDEALGGGRKVYVPAAPGGSSVPQRLTDSQVNETILGRVSALQQCVQEQKARDRDATGVVKMRWSIAPDGAVQSVSCATPEYASSPIAQCLTGVLRGMKFPRSVSGRPDVTFPIKF